MVRIPGDSQDFRGAIQRNLVVTYFDLRVQMRLVGVRASPTVGGPPCGPNTDAAPPPWLADPPPSPRLRTLLFPDCFFV